jgi:hypothetical protein
VAFVATGGGRRWQRIRHLRFESVTAAAGARFALTYSNTGCPAECNVALRRAANGSSVFARIPAFRSSSLGFGDALVGAGANLYAMGFGHVSGGADRAYSRVAISRDRGRSWSVRGDPCRERGPQEVDSTQVVAEGAYVAFLCVGRATGAGCCAATTRVAPGSRPPHPE